jgi:hypothetical protein
MRFVSTSTKLNSCRQLGRLLVSAESFLLVPVAATLSRERIELNYSHLLPSSNTIEHSFSCLGECESYSRSVHPTGACGQHIPDDATHHLKGGVESFASAVIALAPK